MIVYNIYKINYIKYLIKFDNCSIPYTTIYRNIHTWTHPQYVNNWHKWTLALLLTNQTLILQLVFFSNFLRHALFTGSPRLMATAAKYFVRRHKGTQRRKALADGKRQWWGPLCQANNLHAAQFPQHCLTKAVPASWLCTCSISPGDLPQGRCVDGRAFPAQVGTERLYRWLSRLQS